MTTITLVIAISLIALPILPLCELLGAPAPISLDTNLVLNRV